MFCFESQGNEREERLHFRFSSNNANCVPVTHSMKKGCQIKKKKQYLPSQIIQVQVVFCSHHIFWLCGYTVTNGSGSHSFTYCICVYKHFCKFLSPGRVCLTTTPIISRYSTCNSIRTGAFHRHWLTVKGCTNTSYMIPTCRTETLKT